MNMEQLFMALPRDLQWEVLTEFTGTHAVRKGKLRRKLALGFEYQMIKDMHRIQNVVEPYSINYVHATSFVKLTNGRQITCYQGPTGKDITYKFISNGPYDPTRAYHCGQIITSVVPPENSVDLPPYVKHSYPSYEHTDKKKNNMVFVPSY